MCAIVLKAQCTKVISTYTNTFPFNGILVELEILHMTRSYMQVNTITSHLVVNSVHSEKHYTYPKHVWNRGHEHTFTDGRGSGRGCGHRGGAWGWLWLVMGAWSEEMGQRTCSLSPGGLDTVKLVSTAPSIAIVVWILDGSIECINRWSLYVNI